MDAAGVHMIKLRRAEFVRLICTTSGTIRDVDIYMLVALKAGQKRILPLS
jgi:hypothetical protein